MIAPTSEKDIRSTKQQNPRHAVHAAKIVIQDSHLSNSEHSPLSFEKRDLIDLCQDEDLLNLNHISASYARKSLKESVTAMQSRVHSQRELPEEPNLSQQRVENNNRTCVKAQTMAQITGTTSNPFGQFRRKFLD